jgi:hypothetical protein
VDRFKEGVQHMPLQLAGIRQFIGGILYVSFSYKRNLAQRKTMENNHQSILNFALSNGLSTWGVKFISSGLGAILNAVFHCGLL